MKALGLLALGLLVLAACAATAFWWWAGTEGSLAWTLARLGRWQPVQVEGVRGSLRSGLFVERLRWEEQGLKVEAREVRLEWKPLALLTGGLQLDELQARSVRVEDRRPPRPSRAPTSLALPVHPSIDQLRVGTIEWVTPATAVAATDLIAHYHFNGTQHRLQLDRVRWQSGTYRGRASIGAGGALHVNALLEGRFPAAVPGNTEALPLDFSVSLLGPLADLQARGRLQVGTGSPAAGTRANATARLTPWAAQPVPQAEGDFRQLDLHALWREAPRTSLSGQVRVQPAGTATWSLTADLANELPGPWDQQRLPVAALTLQGEWRAGGEALVQRLQARVGGGEVQARGEWGRTGGWAVRGTLSGVNPAAVHSAMAPLPVTGRADLEGAGPAVSFEADLRAGGGARGRRQPGAAGTVQALELRAATARGRWDGALLSLRAFDVRTSDARARGELEVRPRDLAGQGKVTVDAPGLRALADGQLAAASGGGALQLRIADLGQALRWARRLPGAPEALRGLAAAGRGEARVAWQGGWRDPAVQAGIEVPVLEGPAPPTAPGAKAVPAWAVRDAMVTVSGRLSDARVRGRARAELGERRLALELAGQGGRRGERPAVWQGQLAELHLTATDPAIGSGPWTVTLQQAMALRWSEGSLLAGAGQASLLPPAGPQRGPAAAPALLAWEPVRWGGGELRTAGRLTGLPMAWIELLGGPQLAGSALSGDMVFDAQWDASLGATPRVRASLARSRGDVTVLAEGADGQSTRVPAGVRDASVTVDSNGEAVTLSLRWDSERGGAARGELASRLSPGGPAGWHWPANAPLNGTLRAELPRIGVWSLLAPPGWRLRGSLGANITVAGTRGDPQLGGTLTADDLALRSVVDGVELQGGRLRGRLDGQRLVIDEFLLRGSETAGGGGTLVATGEGSWTGEGPQARLTARLDRLRGSIRSDRQLTVSGTLAARVDAAATELTGQLKVDAARILLPEESTPQLGDDVVVRGAATRPTRTQARAAEPQRGDGRRLRLEVDLDLGDDFRVRGHGIDTRLRGTLAVSGQSLAAPRLAGTIRTFGGEYRAYGQWLDIERGVLRFTGPVDNPSLDILAIRPNMIQRVGVQITGSVLSPYVRLYSEPELPDAEKLSWLVVGRPSASGGAEAALVQQAALAMLASRSGQGGKGGIAASLGLDQLSFRRDGVEGPAVTLGKRLGRNFYAAYERSLSGALGTLFIFYDLTRRVTVRAEAGQRTAIDLIFTFTSK